MWWETEEHKDEIRTIKCMKAWTQRIAKVELDACREALRGNTQMTLAVVNAVSGVK